MFQRQVRPADTGIQQAQAELDKTQGEVDLMASMRADFVRLRQRASQIREHNGFEEQMENLLKSQRRPRSHGNGG